MRIYLVRHGKAKDGSPDGARPLTKSGRKEVKLVGKCLRKLDLGDPAILYSPLKRAAQTAKLLAKVLRKKGTLKEERGLEPHRSPGDLRKRIVRMDQDLMLVGHQPFLGELASVLLSGREHADFVDFPKGGVACLERMDKAGRAWTLQWLLDPDLL